MHTDPGSAIRENSLKFRMMQFQRGKQDLIGPSADSNAEFEIGRGPKHQWHISTFSPVNRFRLLTVSSLFNQNNCLFDRY